MSRFTHVIKRSGSIVPFKKERIANAIYRAAVAVGGRDRERAEWLSDKVLEFLEATLPQDHIPHIEEIQDAVEKILIEHGHAKVAKAYILYRDEQAKRRMDWGRRAAQSKENIPWRKLWYVLDWAVEHNLHTIDALNERLRNNEFPQIVHESESAYEDDVDTAIELLTDRADSLKVVIISGPSSSGKTTTTIKIETRLSKRGLKFRPINIDNYFFDLELHPKDEFGDFDFETPQALDLPLINEHLNALVSGKEVMIPYYDFKTGTRTLNQTPMKLDPDEILLIDSLHGLYPPMTEGIPDHTKGKIYIEPLLQMKDTKGEYLHWADLRMIRRMLRDAEHRAYDPQRTLEHWHYVRSSELRHIIPYLHSADIVINSAMPYELPIYRRRLLDSFEEWTKRYEDDPVRQDAYMRASRMFEALRTVDPVEDESPIPSDSIIREFIGGSSLKY
jgi:uridine kinase